LIEKDEYENYKKKDEVEETWRESEKANNEFLLLSVPLRDLNGEP
jgi:hypothetical protein